MVLADRLTMLEDAFEKAAKAATKKESSSEEKTRPSKAPDSELRSVIAMDQQGLQSAKATKKPRNSATKVCGLLEKDAVSPVKYTLATHRRSPRTSPRSVGSMDTSGPPSGSMKTVASERKRASTAFYVSFAGCRTGPQARSKTLKVPETSGIDILYPHVGVCRSFRIFFHGASCLRPYSTSCI